MTKFLPSYARAYWFISPLAPLLLYVGTLAIWLRFGTFTAMVWMLVGTLGTYEWLKPLVNHVGAILSERRRLLLEMVGFVVICVLVVPLLWVVISPDVPMIGGSLLGIAFVSKVEQYWAIRLAERGKLIRWTASGLTVIAAALTTLGIMVLMLTPLCYWLAYAESPAVRFLSKELVYGFTLCHNGGPDYFSLTIAVCVIYFAFALVLGCFMLIGKCFQLAYRGLSSVFGRT